MPNPHTNFDYPTIIGCTKFCMPGAIQDVITHANFGKDD